MSTALGEAMGRVCVFSLAGVSFAVEVSYASEVVGVDGYTVVPRASAHLVGVTNLRGSIVPIVDIRPLLGLPASRISRGTKALVLRVGSGPVAVVIDGVPSLTPVDDVGPLGEPGRREYGEFGVGLIRGEDQLVTLLDAGRVLETLSARLRGNPAPAEKRVAAGATDGAASRG